jgi:hypothetical protein
MALIADNVYVFNIAGTTDYQGNGRAAGIVTNVSGDGVTCNITVFLDGQDMPILLKGVGTTATAHTPYYTISRTS